MAYSKMRGARKPKKEKKVEVLPEHDAFQEQGGKFFESLTEHPWFVGGTVLAIVIITAISLGIASMIKSNDDDDANIYAAGLDLWEEIQTTKAEDSATRDKQLQEVIKNFKTATTDLSGTIEGDSSFVYIGKAYYLLHNCDEAVKNFKKAQTASSIPQKLRFGAYEGEAFCAYDAGKFGDAIKIWEQYIDATKGDLYKDYALFYIGTAYEKSNNQTKAIEAFSKLKKLYPKSALNAKIISKLPQEEHVPEIPKIMKQAS